MGARAHSEEHDLSTGNEPKRAVSVDKVNGTGLPGPVGEPLWLGVVVPKRLARRAVTRMLLKRQIRDGVARHAQSFPPGIWVVRLRTAFDRARFRSAVSDRLRTTIRAEIEQLLAAMARATAAYLPNMPQQ